MKIAIHQMCSGVNFLENTAKMANSIQKAADEGAAMYFAPEMSILLDSNRNRSRDQIATEARSTALEMMQQAAKAASIWVHLGSMPVLHDDGTGRYANRSFIIDKLGQIRGRYDKIHLFDVDLSSGESWRESSAYQGGSEVVIVDTPIGPMGLSICYDLRFPDLYSQLSKSFVNALAVPAAFTEQTGKAHWHVLLRARAIEAEAFVIAAAQSGRHEDGRHTYGHSLVVDPWGEIILDMGAGEGLGFVEIDLKRIEETRRQIPVHKNRKDIPQTVTRY
ncbi:MAG: carbon-nitrogen hydrolase family protein [Sphingorhabdus sp.]